MESQADELAFSTLVTNAQAVKDRNDPPQISQVQLALEAANPVFKDLEATKIKTLVLDRVFQLSSAGDFSKADKEYLERFTECRCFSICGVGLKQLRHLPKMPYLEVLSLADNLIPGDDFQYLRDYKNLKYLDLSNNNIRLMDKLMDLAKLEHLS